MAKALKIVGTIAVVAGLAIVTGGAALGLGLALTTTAFGISAGALILAGSLISTAGSLLAPKPKAPSSSAATTDRLQASINLRTPRTFLLGGPTAFATDVRDQEWATDQSYLDRFIVCASHKVRAIREIWFDDKLAWSSAGGVASPYAGYLTVNTILEGSAANAINTSARMGTTRRYTGCAYIRLRYKLTGNTSKTDSPFAGGSIPTRMTIIGDGIPVPDPRATGFNPADQNTWSTDASACRNPALGMLAYLLGWRINGKLAVGKGIPPARLDLASFATAANLCDEPVTRPNGTSEPRYRCDGIFSEGDETSLVLDNLKATMNAVLDDVDGKIRLSILYNDLATPIGELTTADVLGEYTWDQTAPLSDSVNVIRGGYTDPSTASLFQMVDYPEVRIASTDGIDRVQTINLPLVQSAGQAQRLAKLRLARFQYGGTYTAVFQATAWKFQKGDVIRFSFYPLGWDKKLFRIADMTIQVDGTVPMMLREEHPDIYAAYSDEAAAVQGAAPTNYDPQLWPVIQGIIDVGAQIARAVSDGWLDPSEKRQAKIDYDQRTAQRDALQARYVALGSPASVTTARDNAFARMQDLFNYMEGLSPSWLDYSTQSQVPDPAAYQAAWKASSDALEVFSAAITGLKGDKGDPGQNAPLVLVQWSIDGSTNWHFEYQTGDKFQRQSNDNGASWGPAVRVVGESAQSGVDGISPSIVFIRSATVPATPAQDTGNPPPGWSDDPPAGTMFLWQSVSKFRGGMQLEGWSAPVRISGDKGDKGDAGRDGTNGAPGAPGADGRTSHVHYAYANSPDGKIDFDLNQPNGRAYEGSYTDFTAADSSDPVAYVWREYKGPPFGMAARGAAVVAGNSVVKNGGALAWDADAYSTSGFKNGVFVSFTGQGDNADDFMAGLNTDPTTDLSYTSLDYAWQLSTAGRAQPFESGAPTGGPYIDSYGAGTFRVQYDGRYVRYIYNDVVSRTVDIGPGYTFYFDSSIARPNRSIRNIDYGGFPTRPSNGVTLIADTGNTQIAGNSIRCTLNAGWGAGHSRSQEGYSRGAVASWTIPSDAGRTCDTMAGLSSHPTSSVGFDSISFAIHRNNSGSIFIFSDGNLRKPVKTVDPDTAENKCRVHYDGAKTVNYFVDDVLVDTQIWDYSDTLYFTAALASDNPRIEDVAFLAAGGRGSDGTAGTNGTNGTNGLNGTNGKSIHIAYADSANGQTNFTTGAAGGRFYIGVYTDTNPGADSTNPADYGWTMIRGADGNNGLPGPGGYVHIAYANSANGTVDFHLSDPTGRAYIGTYTDQTEPDSTNPAVYAWQLVKGADGAKGDKGDPGSNGTGINKPNVTAKPSANWAGTGWTLIATSPELAITGGQVVVSASVRYGANSLPGVTGQLSATIALTGGAEVQIGAIGAVGGRALPAGNGDPAAPDNVSLDVSTANNLTSGNYVIRLYARGDNANTAYIDPPRSVLTARNN